METIEQQTPLDGGGGITQNVTVPESVAGAAKSPVVYIVLGLVAVCVIWYLTREKK